MQVAPCAVHRCLRLGAEGGGRKAAACSHPPPPLPAARPGGGGGILRGSSSCSGARALQLQLLPAPLSRLRRQLFLFDGRHFRQHLGGGGGGQLLGAEAACARLRCLAPQTLVNCCTKSEITPSASVSTLSAGASPKYFISFTCSVSRVTAAPTLTSRQCAAACTHHA